MSRSKQKNACIDLGSNMCRLLIGQSDPSHPQGFSILRTYAILISLGKNESFINQKSIVKTMMAIEKCKSIIDQYQNIKSHCIATAIFRSASNATEIIKTISNKYNLSFKIIDPGEEVTLSTFGSFDILPNGLAFVMDMGGGSTEIGLCKKEQKTIHNLGWISIPCGLFFFSRLKTRKYPIPIDEHKALIAFLERSKAQVKEDIPLIICRSGVMSILSKYISRNYNIPKHSTYELTFDKKYIFKTLLKIIQLPDSIIMEQKLVSTSQHLSAVKGMMSFTKDLLYKLPVNNVILCRGGVKEGMMYLACKE